MKPILDERFVNIILKFAQNGLTTIPEYVLAKELNVRNQQKFQFLSAS